MKTFEQIQQAWASQQPTNPTSLKDVMAKAADSSRAIRKKHLGTMVILSITVLVLVLYAVAFVGNFVNQAAIGVMLMIFTLLIRVASEAISYRKFSQLDSSTSLHEYVQQAIAFYHFRKKIFYIVTPLTLLFYFFGFFLLVPALKESVSYGFFIYIIVSGVCFAVFFTILIIKITSKEMKHLNHLISAQNALSVD